VTDQPQVLTFLIADVRGYSRYTEEYGDEAAARLAAKFVDLVAEGVEAHGGTLIEVRGDEGLAVFTSARQAIRAAVDLQAQFADETDAESELPLRVGIGVDSGEAVQLEDGSYRGAALNVAARLCGRAHAGEVIVSAGTSRLAGKLAGLRYTDRGRVHLKNIPEPLHIFQVYSEHDTPPARRPVRTFLSKPGRGLGWRLGLAVVVVAAGTAATVAYLTTGDGGEPAGAALTTDQTDGGAQPPASPIEVALDRDAGLEAIVPAEIWKDCRLQTIAEPSALQTAACLPAGGMPDRWDISSYENGGDLVAAYEAELRRREEVTRDSGRCNAFVWGGEREWLHGPDKPGGRTFCYFDGNDAVIVWTHERLGQPTHRDILIVAREGGSDHVSLTRWWRPWHHLIGKSQ
jgi:class 3 adenylate cyclase